MSGINNNIAWSILPQVLNFGFSFVFTAILARLILPGEYGVYNQVQTVSAFFLIFADGGLVWSIVRDKFIKNKEVVNLFWVNTLGGVLLTVACILMAPVVASFYGNPELLNLMRLEGFIFLLTGMTVPATMWMKRTLAFKKIAVINIAGAIIGGSVGVGCAWSGYGYWSLAIMTLAKGSFTLIISFLWSGVPKGWYSLKTPIGPMLSLGGNLLGFGFVNYFSRNLDNVLIGKFIGSEALAFYAKAYFLMFLPNMLITGGLHGLMVSAMAREQDNPVNFQKLYSRTLRLVSVICIPVTAYFFLYPSDPVLLLYGSNWEASGDILRLLAIACVTQPLYNSLGWILTAKGQGKAFLKWGIFSATTLAIGFSVGIQWGVNGVALSYSLVMGVGLLVLGSWFVHRLNNMSLAVSYKGVIPVVSAGVIAAVLTYVIISALPMPQNLHLSILIKGSLLMALYGATMMLFYKGNIRQLFDIEGKNG
ncbi:MAG: lipopolysaccharide biosynthesis protein [Fibrobacterales bacterium]